MQPECGWTEIENVKRARRLAKLWVLKGKVGRPVV
jgi:hypothetical protein